MLALALLLQAATPPVAAAQPAPAQDAVDLFTGMCVEAALNSAKAHRFDGAPEIARQMTADERSRAMPGDVVSEGWIIRSPRDVWAALWFAPSKRTCGVGVRAADPTGMEAALNARLRTFYGALGIAVAQRPDETLTVNGVATRRASWTITAGSHELAIIASFGDKPVGSYQHLMTFTLLH